MIQRTCSEIIGLQEKFKKRDIPTHKSEKNRPRQIKKYDEGTNNAHQNTTYKTDNKATRNQTR